MGLLQANELSKSYKSRKVIDNISLYVEQGEVVSLLGPNGAGKTTTFHMLLGLVKPDKGNIKLNNIDITKLTIDKRANLGIGFLSQEPSIFRKLTVKENILAILERRNDLNKQQKKVLLEELLEEFHLTHILNALSMTLSGGERRRLEIARSLVSNPQYILLDEPFAGVDPISILDIKNNIQHLSQKNIGVLITDHNVRETLDICHRSYVIYEGNILASGNSQELIENEKVRQIYLGHNFSL